MVKRKKRLGKGIESLERQKEIHFEKRKNAEKVGAEELVRYYDKELQKFEKEQAKKKEKLNR